ncbi:hypothetical protein C8039_19270 [Halogeometricum sp. wsp3]|nr:hypothetical protein C8039_19270 [Halogeometricum sp. wsp3]
MKGLDGEVEVNSDLLDRDDIDANDLEMDTQIERIAFGNRFPAVVDYLGNSDSIANRGAAYEVKNLVTNAGRVPESVRGNC